MSLILLSVLFITLLSSEKQKIKSEISGYRGPSTAADITGIIHEDVYWIQLAEDRVQRRTTVNTLTIIWVSWRVIHCLSKHEII